MRSWNETERNDIFVKRNETKRIKMITFLNPERNKAWFIKNKRTWTIIIMISFFFLLFLSLSFCFWFIRPSAYIYQKRAFCCVLSCIAAFRWSDWKTVTLLIWHDNICWLLWEVGLMDWLGEHQTESKVFVLILYLI
jgi:hypothetical protein